MYELTPRVWPAIGAHTAVSSADGSGDSASDVDEQYPGTVTRCQRSAVPHLLAPALATPVTGRIAAHVCRRGFILAEPKVQHVTAVRMEPYTIQYFGF